jgi:hypothetical protein
VVTGGADPSLNATDLNLLYLFFNRLEFSLHFEDAVLIGVVNAFFR